MKAKSEVWDQKVRSDLCLIYGISRLYWAPHLGPNRSTIRTWAIEIDKTISTLKNAKNWYTIVALSAIIAIFTILDNFTKLLQYFYNTIAILLQYYSNIYNTFTIPLQYFYNTFSIQISQNIAKVSSPAVLCRMADKLCFHFPFVCLFVRLHGNISIRVGR